MVLSTSSGCRDGVCNEDELNSRQNFPVLTPEYPEQGVCVRRVVTIPEDSDEPQPDGEPDAPDPSDTGGGETRIVRECFDLLENIPELIATRPPGGDVGFRLGCIQNLKPAEYSFIVVYSGDCGNGEDYVEEFGTSDFVNGRIVCGRSIDQTLTFFEGGIGQLNSRQLVLCGNPFVRTNNSGMYAASVFVTTRQFSSQSGTPYRIRMVVNDVFPFIRRVRDLGILPDLRNCEPNPNTAILMNWNKTVDIR